jgi:hypothetical protein
MMQKPVNNGFWAYIGFETHYENMNLDLVKYIDYEIRHIPRLLNEIESRAELCLPILKHITDINIKIKEPILVLQKKLDNLKKMKQAMIDQGYKQIVERFVNAKSERDPQSLPNQAPQPTKHQLIFEEVNMLVAHYCQLEHEILKALDTPFKLL